MNRWLACVLLLALAGCGGDDLTGPSEITTEEITVGTGATAALGDVVTVHYTLFLADGTRLESSHDRGSPITFQLGVGATIPGFEQGILGMRVGGKRRVTVPPSLAYGSSGQGSVPPNATLRFEIELVSIAGR
ncbi:MAG TPA: FKBP-type peptidyl-prolyl cis-trans isomerase [Vicinamibacteria bacterium]|nr:FKBP-type peptidyl-prolyl cis-trans isomerase [Vicinamibacteria bacterium]